MLLVIHMLIKEIEPIGEASVCLLDESSDIIDRIIELPLRDACRTFRDKGIETVMSSANKTNLVDDLEKLLKKKTLVIILLKHICFMKLEKDMLG